MTTVFEPAAFVLDVDGVLTNGQFLYSVQGKQYKTFGADDSDALQSLRPIVPIEFVSADFRGFPISRKRVLEDMKFPLSEVPSKERMEWIHSRWPADRVIYMGDGFWDHLIFKKVGYSIAPANAFYRTRSYASFVTQHNGGERAVAEAVLHIAARFFAADKLPLELRP